MIKPLPNKVARTSAHQITRMRLWSDIAVNPEMGHEIADKSLVSFDAKFSDPSLALRLPRPSDDSLGNEFVSLLAVRKMLDDAGIQHINFDTVI